ncbi:basic leucine zipper transcriptional factor ATF-like 2 [Pelodytes ibericus]
MKVENQDCLGMKTFLEKGQCDHSAIKEATILTRRERNRAAANKSRKKNTKRADDLHEMYEILERANSALRKEIQTLQQEAMHWSLVLKKHETTCLLLHPDILLEAIQNADPLLSHNAMVPLGLF